MRLFFGLGLDQQAALALDSWRSRQLLCDGRPVPAANFHLTLAFIGELAPAKLDSLSAAADELVASVEQGPGSILIDQLGYWPRPGILWAGPSRWPQELARLAGALQQLAQRYGARRDKRAFQPHVTLFRNCQSPPTAPPAPPAVRVDCDCLSLYESRQQRSGVSYQSLIDWPLAPPAHSA
jgi:2'-5' RNA ligase